MSTHTKRVEAVERALALLDVFKQGRAMLTLTELAEATGFYKSTVLRLMGTLEHHGYVTRSAQGAYQLGVSVFHLGLLYKQSFDVEDIIRPTLHKLVEATNETAAYYVRVGDQRLCQYRVNSPRSARHHLEEGSFLSVDKGATGHVLLAFDKPKNLREADRQTREQGYYISLGERDPDVAAVAVPVLDEHGVAYGALSVSGLMSRYNEGRRYQALEHLQREAQALSKALRKHYLKARNETG